MTAEKKRDKDFIGEQETQKILRDEEAMQALRGVGIDEAGECQPSSDVMAFMARFTKKYGEALRNLAKR
jgi:hypothetical protein